MHCFSTREGHSSLWYMPSENTGKYVYEMREWLGLHPNNLKGAQAGRLQHFVRNRGVLLFSIALSTFGGRFMQSQWYQSLHLVHCTIFLPSSGSLHAQYTRILFQNTTSGIFSSIYWWKQSWCMFGCTHNLPKLKSEYPGRGQLHILFSLHDWNITEVICFSVLQLDV